MLGIEPHEMLGNPLLEERAREISRNIRCMVCQNESIDESNAELASDMRILIREKLVEGYTNQEIYDYVEERYGEFALLRPVLNAQNLILYLSGPILLILFCLGAIRQVRRRNSLLAQNDNELTADETKELRKLVGQDTSHS